MQAVISFIVTQTLLITQDTLIASRASFCHDVHKIHVETCSGLRRVVYAKEAAQAHFYQKPMQVSMVFKDHFKMTKKKR